MQLLCTLTSPFARKVRMFAIEKGLGDVLHVVTANPLEDPAALLRVNPLAKIPALITAEGEPLYDSRVICAFLDSLAATPRLIPDAGNQRWIVLRREALADGLMDAAVAIVFERRRPAPEQSAEWLDRWLAKIERALVAMEEEHRSDALVAARLDGIACAAALGYLAFRLPEIDWTATHPALANWWADVAQRPAVTQTAAP
ncbi:MAG: glutathione S-transferase N-terminal domain-containing protein [Pseudomonadota bacterium]|nr:glutathione S-transferase N-terminal domain-containing protein [Pseudomonadota bacterium]